MNPDFIRKMRFFIIAILKSLTRNIKAKVVITDLLNLLLKEWKYEKKTSLEVIHHQLQAVFFTVFKYYFISFNDLFSF